MSVISSAFRIVVFVYYKSKAELLFFINIYLFTKSLFVELSLTFNISGIYVAVVESIYKNIDIKKSTVDKLAYGEQKEEYSESGAWSYKSGTKKILIINESFDENGISEGLNVGEFLIEKVSNDKFVAKYSETYDGKLHEGSAVYERQ